ncbi:hypothetical protein Tco_0838033 [Tanacetum coccineum]
MSITKEQQQALDDALVPREQRLTIGSFNYRLSTTFKPKEPTFQVTLDVLTLTPIYSAFLITVSVPAVYMHEFWATVTYQKDHIRFKMNKKSYSIDMETFRNMLLICPKLPGQKFVDPPFKEEILTLIRELGYPGNIKLLSDFKVDTLPQSWRNFGTIINKCLSDLVFQIENKESRKKKYMFYLRFTKVIINHFMSQDQSIPRRNKVDWHMANDDPILTTMRFIPQHEVVQRYGAILPDYLTNPTMKQSEAYKTYHDLATGKVEPKPKYVRRSSRTKADEAPKPSSGKRVKSTAKVAKFGKKKQPALRLETLSEITLTKAKQLKLATKRSLIQTHSSHASESGAHEGTGVTLRVPNVPDYESDDEKISGKSSKEEDDDEVNVSEHDDEDDDEWTESDNDGEDFVHPKFSNHDDEARQEEVNEEDSFDPRVQTPSYVETTDNDNSDEEVQGANTEEEEMVEEATYEEDEANKLYRDVNVNLEGRDTVMTDAPLPNVQATQEIEDTHVILTAPIIPEGQQQSSSVSSRFVSNMLNPRPDTCIDLIFNTEATLLVVVLVTTIVEPPLVSATTLPPPPTPLITHMQQTPFPIPTTAPSTSLQDLPNFAVSSILGIVDAYLENKMNEAIKIVVQLQSNRLRDEAQAKNEDFLNKLDDNIKKIIKDKVKQQVKAQVSKILPKIEKTVNEQLEAEALDEPYKSDKLILDTYGDTFSFKRHRDDEDKDEEPSAGLNRGSKRRRVGKEPESTSAPKEKTSKTTGKSNEGSKSQHQYTSQTAQAEDPMHTADDFEKPTHQEFETGVADDQPKEETYPLSDWFQKPTRPPTPDRDWNKTLTADHGPIQPWLSNLARQENPRESFDELTDTPFDFSAFVMNRLNVETLTPELLAGPKFELIKGTCKSLVMLEYFFEEVYKATIEQLDWYNPEGQLYPHDLQKPLPLIPNSRGRQVIPFDHFINNDLAYLYGGVSSRTYATFVTKTKAADYSHIKWIEELVPNAMESARDVYSRRRIIAVTKLQIVEWHSYKHLDWIIVRRDDDKLHTFKEGDFKRLHLQDIKDMLLINLNVEERVESYQKKLNITKPDSYISDIKRREAYFAYSNPIGFIYQNRDKKNKLIRVDELQKFSDITLNDVRTTLDDCLKGIRMEYLPQTIWR